MFEPEPHHDLRLSLPLVVLTGFRATGKTAVGRILANLLGYRFVDTDEVITGWLGCSIAESVTRYGWQPFRDFEQKVLKELAEEENTVIATGGGAVLHRETWQQLHNKAFVIWLRADVATIQSRLEADGKTAMQRPSLSGQDPETEIVALLAKREPMYRAGSDIIIDTEDRTPKALAATVFQQLIANSADS
ncbi:MAG: shikimate kinase [Thermodesulfobacteriota bacterium]|nr:shikimate kinase [Thermodesulfobacteriota bacterium]